VSLIEGQSRYGVGLLFLTESRKEKTKMDPEGIENEVGSEFDAAGEGLRTPDELDLAQDLEDRQAVESREESATEDEDLSGERFAYTLPDGTEFQGTVDEIAAKIAEGQGSQELETLRSRVAELEGKGQQQTQQPPQEAAGINPVAWEQVGNVFTTMLEGGDPERDIGGVEAIGPALQDLNFRSFMTDWRYLDAIERVIDARIASRETAAQERGTLKESLGDMGDAELAALQGADPVVKSTVLNLIGNLKREIETLKAGKEAAAKDGEKKGAAETVKSLKAKGQLRRISGMPASGKTGSGQAKRNYDFSSENARIAAGVDIVQRMRQGR